MIQIINFKNISKIIALSAVMLVMVLTLWTTAYAIPDYTVLAPLPGTVNDGNTTNLGKYLPGLFNFSIGLAAFAAFVMITFGGILYMTTDAINNKSQGREYIENALWGLLLVISAWIILYTINPKILNFNLDTPTPPSAERDASVIAGPAGIPMTQAQIDASNAVLTSLNPISVGPQIKPYAGLCLRGQTVGCVNLNGLQQSTIAGLQNLRDKCNCNITITGGTEGGHTSGSCHNIGICVDIYGSKAINDLVTNQTFNIPACTTYNFGLGKFLYEPIGSTCGGEVASSGEHWHVQM